MTMNLESWVGQLSSEATDHTAIFAACSALEYSLAEFADFLAEEIANSYLHRRQDWATCNQAMAKLFHWAYSERGPGLSEFGWFVYAAIYLGEDKHPGQPAQAGHEYYVRPSLVHACAKRIASTQLSKEPC